MRQALRDLREFLGRLNNLNCLAYRFRFFLWGNDIGMLPFRRLKAISVSVFNWLVEAVFRRVLICSLDVLLDIRRCKNAELSFSSLLMFAFGLAEGGVCGSFMTSVYKILHLPQERYGCASEICHRYGGTDLLLGRDIYPFSRHLQTPRE